MAADTDLLLAVFRMAVLQDMDEHLGYRTQFDITLKNDTFRVSLSGHHSERKVTALQEALQCRLVRAYDMGDTYRIVAVRHEAIRPLSRANRTAQIACGVL